MICFNVVFVWWDLMDGWLAGWRRVGWVVEVRFL